MIVLVVITVLVYFDLFEVLSFWCNINWKKDGFDNVVLMTKPFSEHKKDKNFYYLLHT